MFKRSTKITSLILAAASVASMVPAMAADKIADKDGTVYKAVAYKDGKLYIDGDDLESANDTDGVYYLDGGKYSDVEDIDSGDTVYGTYGEKYIEIEDGDYYLDLETGKTTDDFLRGDDREDAATALKKKIRKDDPSRYTEDSRTTQAQVDVKETVESDTEIWEVPAATYTAPYYQTNHYKFASDKAGKVVNRTATVYTDKDGKYIDADHDLGTVNVIVTEDGSLNVPAGGKVSTAEAVSFSSVDSKKNKSKNVEVKVSVEHIKTLTSDEKYIYRIAALHVATAPVTNGTTGTFTNVADGEEVCFGSTKNPVRVEAADGGRFYVIQKISKEQGDDEDDAKLPKSTATYFISDYKDWRKKEETIKSMPEDDDRTLLDVDQYGDPKTDGQDSFDEEFKDREDNDVAYTVVDGKISRYDVIDENGSFLKGDDGKFVVKTLSLKSQNGYYYVGADKNDDDFEDSDEFAVSVDKDGNIWKLDSGKIYKYKNDGDYELMYKCDGGFNELSVYDDKNLIAYNEDDDTYAIIGGKSSTGKYDVETEDNQTTTSAAGWVQDAAGKWSYVKADGTKAIGWLQSPASGLWYYMDANGMMMQNGWIQDAGKWYFLKADGAMATGWQLVGGTWYFMNNSGAMQTGWVQSGSKWYYLNASGAMLKSTTVNGYVLGADGAWIK